MTVFMFVFFLFFQILFYQVICIQNLSISSMFLCHISTDILYFIGVCSNNVLFYSSFVNWDWFSCFLTFCWLLNKGLLNLSAILTNHLVDTVCCSFNLYLINLYSDIYYFFPSVSCLGISFLFFQSLGASQGCLFEIPFVLVK